MPRSGDNYDYPAGTLGISGQTIFSARYNAWVEDIKATLNLPLPVSKGGTGASNISGTGGARDNLNVPAIEQKITNWALMEVNGLPAEQGFVWSDTTPDAGAPVSGHPFAGTYYWGDVPTPPAGPQNAVVVLQDLHSSAVPGITYIKQKKGGGAWSAWQVQGSGQFVLKTGDTMTGPLVVIPNGSTIGSFGGSVSTGAVTPADAQIKFYDGGSGNWCGMGVDGSGTFWLRTGLSGGVLPAFRTTTNRSTVFNGSIYSANTNTTGTLQFGLSDTKFLQFDGATFTFSGGNLSVTGNTTLGTTGTAAGYIVAANGQLNLLAASGTANRIVFQNNAAAIMGTIAYDPAINQMLFGHQGASTLPLAVWANGAIQLGCGFVGRSGSSGGTDPQLHNLMWNGTGTNLYINVANLGQITTSCDYRIKRDVEALPSTWEQVKALNPITFRYRDYLDVFKESDEPQWGFLAHELQETLLPSAATGSKDAENIVQSPNLLAIVAGLTKALQEAMARIEVLEARL